MRQFLSPSGVRRLDRIMELRQCTEIAAFEFAISAGWFTAEKLEMEDQRRKAKRMAKSAPKPDPGKAPNTGSNTKNDNKATDTGKAYPPNRPKAD